MPLDIVFDRVGRGYSVTFNRPEVRNALTPAMLAEFGEFIGVIERDETAGYLLIKGAGDHFSAGGDITAYAEMLRLEPEERRRAFEDRVRANIGTICRLYALRVPVICLVRGATAGAALSMLLAADFVLAANDALIVFAQPRIALPLDFGLTYLLPRVVGTKVARQLAFTAPQITAAEGEGLGILDEVHPPAALDGAVDALLKRLEVAAPRAAQRTKSLLLASETRALEAQMEAEIKVIGQCVTEPEFDERIAAFVAKRRPHSGS